ncbi:hypothetical protein LWI29_031843 [Acer saccharum]|uniref:Kinesin-like protein n=1 Tax=Acer saccharum TaxID=4024 RepID=A0AA39RTC2_ACESA|nr:hypothetical protein LWI29_031843 [Acer saccharum]
MECSKVKKSSQNVRVAVNIRPLLTRELLLGCTDCITVVPGEPQVRIGSHAFTFDYVYGNMGSPSTTIYDDCVAPLVEALFHGFNATVLAYGQTGSGKTYMMGTSGEGSNSGVIPKVMESIFKKIDSMEEREEFFTRVSFIEILNEDVFDLLGVDSSSSKKSEEAFLAKPVVPERVPLQIREKKNGGIKLDGVFEAKVTTKEGMKLQLLRGSLSRATGSTNMNSQSSRSHAIFTITVEQKKIAHIGAGGDISCVKLHLVDLAGTERSKRTCAEGMRLKEGIHINKSLLALGNVISALGDEKKLKDGGHVPYRDSKLTRLLQINRNPVAAEMQRMRSQIEQLQAELECRVSCERCSELAGELLRVKNSHNLNRSRASDCVDTDDDGFQSKNVLFPLNEFSYECDTKAADIPVVDEEKELENSSLQEKLGREHKELDKKLEQKEVKNFNTKKIFVGGLPPAVSKDELKDCFSKYGNVLEHWIVRDHETNRSRGFGFVVFDSMEDVNELLSNVNTIDMFGTQVEIKKAVPREASIPQPPPPFGPRPPPPFGPQPPPPFGGYSYGGFDGEFGSPAEYGPPPPFGPRPPPPFGPQPPPPFGGYSYGGFDGEFGPPAEYGGGYRGFGGYRGITAASGIAAELGIPLTHRGVANSVRFLTGHSRKGGTDPLFVAENAADPDSTLVVYMGLSTLPSLALKF